MVHHWFFFPQGIPINAIWMNLLIIIHFLIQELNSGHIAQLSDIFKKITDTIENQKEPKNVNLEKLFDLDFHLIIPFINSLVFV